MPLGNHQRSVEYPYSHDEVFEALLAALASVKGLQLQSADKPTGRVVVKAGVSLSSWGEMIPISLAASTPRRTRLRIASAPLGFLGGGADATQNIDRVLAAVSRVLTTRP